MDRQDIDALLIGALYGELTPAEEARLAAHLESHPADRGALDDLKRARQAVRESRIFDQQLEPPQAVSALLLQEAHRRAPKAPPASGEKESWFFRFTRVFLAHPAMAAAAMLVLVVGVAGTLYMKKGDQFADQEVAAPTSRHMEAPAEEPGAMDRGLVEGADGTAAGSGYSVGLDDNIEKAPATTTALAQDREAADRAEADKRAQTGKLAEERSKADGYRGREAKNKMQSAIVVDTPRGEPKELDEPRAKTARKATAQPKGDSMRYDDSVMIGGAGGGAAPTGTAQSATVPRAPVAGNAPSAAPMPPPPPVATTKSAAKPAKKEAQSAPAEAKPEPAKDSSLIAWAKSEHNRAINLASSGDCRGAARLAVVVEGRAPDYYAQFMATDRSLKKCQAYVAAEREAEAQKARAAKTRATEAQ
jgi:hypothetical protein